MFGDLYSMEADNDEIELDAAVTTNDETAVTEAGTDTEATDVSNISEKTEAHNELASTGGVATGSDTADMEMDPVAATESYCFKRFSMSAEDIAAEVEENIKVAKEIPDANTEEDNTDPELEAVGMNNAGISTEDPADIIPDETPADTAGMTPDADESKDDGEDDADAPKNPVPPALPTSEESLDQSVEKIYGYFKSKDFKIAKKDRVKGGYKKLAFNNASEFLKSEIGKSKIAQFKEDVKKKGLTFATKKEIQTQKPTIGNILVRGLTPTNAPRSANKVVIKAMNVKFVETDGIIFGTWTGRDWFSIVALVKMKNGKIGTKGYAISVPCRITEEVTNIDSKSKESLTSDVPFMDFI
jgi:hypothetical protein